MAANLIGAALLSRSREDRDFPLPDKPTITVGYDRSNDLSIPFEGISRRHARISYDGKEYWIEDIGSANGTFLNSVLLETRQRLKHLDILTLGRRADLIFVRRSVDRARKTRRGIVAARLEIIDGLEAGTSREIPRGSVTIGRSHSNNIVADSQLVSKVHARVERSGVQLVLTDLQSANGTFVNGEQIDSKVLKDGDEIRVGHTRSYRVRIEEGEVMTGDVPTAGTTTSYQILSLPADWKTCMEWSPEEAAVLDRVSRQGREGVRQQPGSKPGKTAIAPRPTKPEHKPVAKPPEAPTPAKPEAAAPPPKPAAPSAPPPPAPTPESQPLLKPPAASKHDVPTLPMTPPPEPGGQAAGKPAVEKPPAQRVSEAATRPMAPGEAVPPRLLLEGETRTIPVSIGIHDIGRLSASSICLDGPVISRRHAVLRVSETEAILEDLQTANGTFVNKERLTAPRSIADGDVVAFGTMAFRVRMAPASPSKPPAKL